MKGSYDQRETQRFRIPTQLDHAQFNHLLKSHIKIHTDADPRLDHITNFELYTYVLYR